MHELAIETKTSKNLLTGILTPSENSDTAVDWHSWNGLLLHKELFTQGIIAIRKDDDVPTQLEEFNISTSEFFLGSRTLHFPLISNKSSNYPIKLFSSQYSSAQHLYDILKVIVPAKHLSTANNCPIVVNKNRREEIFIQAQIGNIGCYIYPWSSKSIADFKAIKHFAGFEQFVTAGCIFGTSLEAIDQNGCSFPLIKHDIKFHQNQKIMHVTFNHSKLSPYEQMLFNEQKKLATIITTCAAVDKQKKLIYHLPYYDYILFGIELFIRGRMTFKALDKLINVILIRKQEHIKKIQEIFTPYQINVTIESPFEHIFSPITDKNFTCKLLDFLNLSANEQDYQFISDEESKIREKKLVQDCLEKLKNPKCNSKSYDVWADFIDIEIVNKQKIETLEDLFKIANAVMLGSTAKNTKNYTTCSVLPISEKQIQVSYSNFSKKDKNCKYPTILNLSLLDPILSYSPNTAGLLFYFRGCEQSLTRLITKKQILNHAAQNIINMIQMQQGNIKIEAALSSPKNPLPLPLSQDQEMTTLTCKK